VKKKLSTTLTFTIFTIAIALRLYPTLLSGLPFSTDGWSSIRNAEQLIANTPVSLTNTNIFDPYHIYGPANSIFGAILTQITSIPPINTMAIGIPIIGALALPIFFILTKKITKDNKIALIATVLLATAYPYTLFAAGVTKETFASPIYISLILIFLLKHNLKTVLLFTLVSIALVLSHHLTAFLTVTILASLAIALFVSKKSENQILNSNKTNITLIAILTTITALYFGLHASSAITALSHSDLLTVAAYQTIIIAGILYFINKPRPSKPAKIRTILKCAIAILALTIFLFLVTKIAILPGTPMMPLRYLLYALPFIITAPLIIFGLNKKYKKNRSLMLPLFWLLTPIGIAIYAIFANPPIGLTLAARSINFILPPLAILTAIALQKIIRTQKHPQGKIVKILVISIILTMAATNTYTLYATVSLQEPYLGYFWRYKQPEYVASEWLSQSSQNQPVAADSKVSYLLRDYFSTKVNVLHGLRYIEGSGTQPELLYIYNQMNTNGYVLYQGVPITLPANWTDKLTDFNCIYNNHEVTIYAKR
jgi:hypothetical protein